MVGTKAEVIKALVDLPDDKTYELREYHAKRSLTANSYYWTLLGQLSGLLGAERDEIHYELLRRFSVPYTTTDGQIVTIVSRIGSDMLPGYWVLVDQRDDRSGFMRIKGSSDMDSREFSKLLDGLIEECKEVDIETMTPQQLEELKGYEKHLS